MKVSSLFWGLALACGATAASADSSLILKSKDGIVQFNPGPNGPVFIKSVPLLTDESLEHLQRSNPHDYAIARDIIKAAGKICAPAAAGTPEVLPAAFNADDVSCSAGDWLTSNPPKRRLSFRIATTAYWTLVAVPIAVVPVPTGPAQAIAK